MFKYKADPTFPATVKIRKAGGSFIEIPVVFKHKRIDAAHQFFMDAAANGTPDVDCIMELVDSWGAEAPFSRETVIDLMQEHGNTPEAFFTCYLAELKGARLGN